MQYAIENNKNIIWDQTNLNTKTRKAKLSKIPDNYTKIAVVFSTKYDILEQVNEERQHFGRAIPKSIFQSMIKSYQEPTYDDGFDDIIKVERKE